jgi:hypothetical protein
LISKIISVTKADRTMMFRTLVKALGLTPEPEETKARRIRKGMPSEIASTAMKERDSMAVTNQL